jgi:hypothetical protein
MAATYDDIISELLIKPEKLDSSTWYFCSDLDESFVNRRKISSFECKSDYIFPGCSRFTIYHNDDKNEYHKTKIYKTVCNLASLENHEKSVMRKIYQECANKNFNQCYVIIVSTIKLDLNINSRAVRKMLRFDQSFNILKDSDDEDLFPSVRFDSDNSGFALQFFDGSTFIGDDSKKGYGIIGFLRKMVNICMLNIMIFRHIKCQHYCRSFMIDFLIYGTI